MRAIRQIRGAIDQGVNYLDTAGPTMRARRCWARLLQDGYRCRVKLATKLPSWMIKSRADMDRFLAAQLKKLNTDRIDYYLLHAPGRRGLGQFARPGVLDFLAQAKADGRIVNAGFSFHGLAGDFTRIVDAAPWVFCQIQYNYLDQTHRRNSRPGIRVAAKGLGVIVMELCAAATWWLAQPPPAIEGARARSPRPAHAGRGAALPLEPARKSP